LPECGYNFPYVFKGAPGRAGPGRARPQVTRDAAEVTEGNRDLP
jgi:hypothetical protein